MTELKNRILGTAKEQLVNTGDVQVASDKMALLQRPFVVIKDIFMTYFLSLNKQKEPCI